MFRKKIQENHVRKQIFFKKAFTARNKGCSNQPKESRKAIDNFKQLDKHPFFL
jgi:hypothetical protein